MKESKVIAIDFDGTMVEHEFPKIGKPVPFAINVCKRLVRAGHKIMLWTMRSDNHISWSKVIDKQQPFENMLTEAVKYMRDNGIELWGINKNPQQDWSSSNKQYAHIYIDDAALGCPLVTEISEWGDENGLNTKLEKPYVNWSEVDSLLQIQGYYDRTTYCISQPLFKEPKKFNYTRKGIVQELVYQLQTHYEDVFVAQNHNKYDDHFVGLPNIGGALWYKGAGLYVDFELIVSSELLEDEDTDIAFVIGDKHFSITCHND